MSTASAPATILASTPPSTPRLVLTPTRAPRAILDGGWWPRSWDPLAELPGLVLALSDRYGPIRHMMINSNTWNGHIRRLVVGAEVIGIGWFLSQSSALLIATTDAGDQLDIFVVAPQTSPEAADLAMTAAADPAGARRAPEILAALATAAVRHSTDSPDANAVWDNEGGRIVASASPMPA
jgi:hypothetical protein